jgi:hypothetical protein
MMFARRVFQVAAIYGFLAVVPLYFSEGKIDRDYPPAITHPEYFYAFAGVALAWQAAFVIIARDPVRYRLMMLPSALEKLSYAVAGAVLYAQGRVVALFLLFAAIDLTLGALFLVAFQKTREA